MRLKKYLTDKAVINSTIVNKFDFLAATSATELTNMIRLKYDYAEMYHTTESEVLVDTETALDMYSNQLQKLYNAYTKVYDPEDGYTKTTETVEQHSGSDTELTDEVHSGEDNTSSSGESSTSNSLSTRTYDNDTMTVTESNSGSSEDSNDVTTTHGHRVDNDLTKNYGHRLEGEIVETGTLPITEALNNYVTFARFNFYEYVVDIIARYITIPGYSVDMEGDNE